MTDFGFSFVHRRLICPRLADYEEEFPNRLATVNAARTENSDCGTFRRQAYTNYLPGNLRYSADNRCSKTLFGEHMNINYRIRTRLVHVLSSDLSSAQDVHTENGKVVHRAAVEAHVRGLVGKYRFRLRLQKVLSHQEDKRQSATHAE